MGESLFSNFDTFWQAFIAWFSYTGFIGLVSLTAVAFWNAFRKKKDKADKEV